MSAQSPASPDNSLPNRSATGGSNTDGDDAIPDEDASETTKLFHERLQAWKHACGYLEEYIKANEKMVHDTSKEYQKVLKAVNNPLKEGHHFHQQNGGVAEMFDNIRSNTQGISNSQEETARGLKASVLPVFERLHSEIKNKAKELEKGAGKTTKAVDKARGSSQKHIELLGEHAAAYDSRGGNNKAADDPYLIQRQVYHRLHKQVIEENNNRDDTLAVQNEFAKFEAHILQQFQEGLASFNQLMSNQCDNTRNIYGDMLAVAQRIPSDFEWQGFVQRNNNILIDPNGPKRSLEHINFANQDHPSTRPLIAGSLERKGKLLKKYDTAYYVVTPSKYLHEFKSDDDFAKDPSAESSLYLPDCMIGAVDGDKFNVKGKDSSKGAMSKMSMSHEFAFKAHTPQDAQKWHDVILGVSGGAGTNSAPSSAPSSPVVNDNKTEEPSRESNMTTGTTLTEGPATEKDVGGNSVSPTTSRTTEKDMASSPTGDQTTSTKQNDYAPL